MPDLVTCLDSGVWIKFLVPEPPLDQSQAAVELVSRLLDGGRLVAPAFAWAEVGSVLRKKARSGEIEIEQSDRLWKSFSKLPIQYLELDSIRVRSWDLATRFELPTLYDAAFLACTELAPAEDGAVRELWTADRVLVKALGRDRPAYVRELVAGR